MTLIEQLKQIPDPRRRRGRRYPLWGLLLMMILGSLCNRIGYRSLAAFCSEHWQVLCELSGMEAGSASPSYATFRRLAQQVDYEDLAVVLQGWCVRWLFPEQGAWIGGDGKSIRCTRTGDGGDFISTVSLFAHALGTVVGIAVMRNAKQSEIALIRRLIEQVAGCLDATFTLDALHCQKQTVQQIVAQGQHYVIALKGNQKWLWRTLTEWVRTQTPLSLAQVEDSTHGRWVSRSVAVFDVPPAVTAQWSNAQRVIAVTRTSLRQGQWLERQTLYISDLSLPACQWLTRIQARWGIENRLHWVRDATFHEDYPPRTGGHAPANWALIHCWIISVVRRLGYRTVPLGMQALANQVHQVFRILTHGFSSA